MNCELQEYRITIPYECKKRKKFKGYLLVYTVEAYSHTDAIIRFLAPLQEKDNQFQFYESNGTLKQQKYALENNLVVAMVNRPNLGFDDDDFVNFYIDFNSYFPECIKEKPNYEYRWSPGFFKSFIDLNNDHIVDKATSTIYHLNTYGYEFPYEYDYVLEVKESSDNRIEFWFYDDFHYDNRELLFGSPSNKLTDEEKQELLNKYLGGELQTFISGDILKREGEKLGLLW